MALKLSTKQVWLAGGCLVGALLWMGTQSSKEETEPAHRRLNEEFHIDLAKERDVEPRFDTTQLQFMSSPCRPESDGYFGSTYGAPLEIQFGFELETEDAENVEYLLEEIQEQVVDIVLATSFPNLCGYRRRHERARHLSMRGLSTTEESQQQAKPRTTGFKFAMDLDQRSDVCAPVVDPTNLCGVYKNTIGVYGRQLADIGEHLLVQIKETLNGEHERLAKDGVVRLTTLDSLTHQNGDYGEKPTGVQALSFAAKAAIIVVIMALLAGITTFLAYVYSERQRDRLERHSYAQPAKTKTSSNSTVGCEEASQLSETVGLRDGTAVVLEGGRPVLIEFEHLASTSNSRMKDAVEEERSVAGSTLFAHSVDGSPSLQYVPQGLWKNDEECKEPEDFQMRHIDLSASGTQLADGQPRSMASLSEYTEQSARTASLSNHQFS